MFPIVLSLLFLNTSLYSEEFELEECPLEECPCPILLDTLQFDLELIQLPPADLWDDTVLQ
jgi:hypothetical protein